MFLDSLPLQYRIQDYITPIDKFDTVVRPVPFIKNTDTDLISEVYLIFSYLPFATV